MKAALGKGLGSLIPEKGTRREILELDIDTVVPNDYQPRRVFKDDALADLTRSIREKGVIQPVIVKRESVSTFQLIAGERRWRAAKKAGLKKIPAIVKDAAPAEALELALIENIQREDLTPIEAAEAFQRLINDFNLTHDELSQKVGKDRATVTNYLRILRLPPDIKQWISDGELSTGHAKALLQIDSPERQLEAARRIIQKGLSVREAEALSKRSFAGTSGRKTRTSRDPHIAALEDRLKQSLGTKVAVVHKGKKGGRIEIEYYSLDELDRLLEILLPS